MVKRVRLPDYEGCMVTIGRFPELTNVLPERRSFIEVHDYIRNHKEGSLTTVVTDRGTDIISQ